MAGPQSLTEGPPPQTKISFRDVVSGPPRPSHVDQPLKEESSYKGEPALFYSPDEITALAAPFQLYLVGKFLGDRPSMDFLKRGFSTIGFKGEFNIGLLDSKHVLIRFSQQDDYHRCWMHGTWNFKKHTMKILKWTPDFSPREPPIVPVWVSLEQLPIHFFQKSPLLSLASLIGKPLKVDGATQSLSRPSVARVCVEVNLAKPLPNRVWIGHGTFSFWQHITYENLPEYCSTCHRIGHAIGNCGHADVPPAQDPQPKKIWRPKVTIQPVPTTSPNPSASANPEFQQAAPSKHTEIERPRADTTHHSSGLSPTEKDSVPIDITSLPLVLSQPSSQTQDQPQDPNRAQDQVPLLDYPRVSSFPICDDGTRPKKAVRDEPHPLSDSEATEANTAKLRSTSMDEFLDFQRHMNLLPLFKHTKRRPRKNYFSVTKTVCTRSQAGSLPPSQ